jgi:hypothetical protein
MPETERNQPPSPIDGIDMEDGLKNQNINQP